MVDSKEGAGSEPPEKAPDGSGFLGLPGHRDHRGRLGKLPHSNMPKTPFRLEQGKVLRLLSGHAGSLALDYVLRLSNQGPACLVVSIDGQQKHLLSQGESDEFILSGKSQVDLLLHSTNQAKLAQGAYELFLHFG